MKYQTEKRGDYQSDIYDARVRIAIAKWEAGYIPRRESKKREAHIEELD